MNAIMKNENKLPLILCRMGHHVNIILISLIDIVYVPRVGAGVEH